VGLRATSAAALNGVEPPLVWITKSTSEASNARACYIGKAIDGLCHADVTSAISRDARYPQVPSTDSATHRI
jgi:hypothetical protein